MTKYYITDCFKDDKTNEWDAIVVRGPFETRQSANDYLVSNPNCADIAVVVSGNDDCVTEQNQEYYEQNLLEWKERKCAVRQRRAEYLKNLEA
jgi:hypothetical protein